MEEILEFLKDSQVFYLATVEDGQPRVRPFGAVTEFENKLYIVTNNQKPVFKQLQDNPSVEISSMDKNGRWLRVSAKAISDSRREAKEKMLEDVPSLKSMYSVDDGKIEVLYLKDATATIASFADAPKTVQF